MKLFELSLTDKIKLAAELDGWHRDGCEYDEERWKRGTETHIGNPMRKAATSYDAIIPLIQKLGNPVAFKCMDYIITKWEIACKEIGSHNTPCIFTATPSQLLDALLVATGKAEL